MQKRVPGVEPGRREAVFGGVAVGRCYYDTFVEADEEADEEACEWRELMHAASCEAAAVDEHD